MTQPTSNERFDKIDTQLERITTALVKGFADVDKRIDNLEVRFDERIDTVTNLIDGYAGKIDSYAQEMAL